MVKKDLLVRDLQKRLNIVSLPESLRVLDLISSVIEENLIKHGSVKLEGIGIINIVTKKGRAHVMPTLDEPVVVPDRKSAVIVPSKIIKYELNKKVDAREEELKKYYI